VAIRDYKEDLYQNEWSTCISMLETGELGCLLWVRLLFDHRDNTGWGLSSVLLWPMTGTQDAQMKDLTTALAHVT